eukprot:2576280-Pleurochrysis_carterae.AAC.1
MRDGYIARVDQEVGQMNWAGGLETGLKEKLPKDAGSWGHACMKKATAARRGQRERRRCGCESRWQKS